MSDADFDFELRRMFFGFGGAIALLIVFYVCRVLKIYLFGKRVRAVVAKVVKKEEKDVPMDFWRRPMRFSYVLDYQDEQGVQRRVHERPEIGHSALQFQVGDVVTAFVQSERRVEILSWRRLFASALVLCLTAGALYAGYYFLLVRKNA